MRAIVHEAAFPAVERQSWKEEEKEEELKTIAHEAASPTAERHGWMKEEAELRAIGDEKGAELGGAE